MRSALVSTFPCQGADYCSRARSAPHCPGVTTTPAWTPATTSVNGIRLHHRVAGDGPPVVLLHGWPQTGWCWRRVVDDLARDHTVIVPDLRGYGASDKARTGMDKRTMAADLSALLRALGVDEHAPSSGTTAAGGWPTAGPSTTPTRSPGWPCSTSPRPGPPGRASTPTSGAKYWHWLFHLQPDLPERLAGADVDGYLRYFFEKWTTARQHVDEAVPVYVEAFSKPGALRCGFDDYRADPVDAAHDDESFAAGHRLDVPLLALWGADGVMDDAADPRPVARVPPVP